MKANWKVALMCVATIAFVACNEKNKPVGPGGGGGVDPSYESPIKVNDQSIADWDKLDQKYVAVFNVTPQPLWSAIKQLKVYSDEVYINYMLVIDPVQYRSHTPNDAMHVYINIDNSDATGGFFDSFSDAAVDVMMEGPLFDDAGKAISYVPTAHTWVGPEGGKPEDRTGEWEEVWEAAGTVRGESQFIGDSIIEGRLLVDLIPGEFTANKFGIGFDLQQNWGNIGLLPQLDTPNGENVGRTTMLTVTFDTTE